VSVHTRPLESAGDAVVHYARPVSGAVVCHKSSEEDFPRMVAMVTLLFILRSGSFSPSPRQAFAPTLRLVHQQMKNTHLSASSKGRGDRAAEFQLDLFSPVKMSVKVEIFRTK